MADSGITLLTDAKLHALYAKASRERAEQLFCAKRVVPQYEGYYQEVISAK
jgi:hypothetical protein